MRSKDSTHQFHQQTGNNRVLTVVSWSYTWMLAILMVKIHHNLPDYYQHRTVQCYAAIKSSHRQLLIGGYFLDTHRKRKTRTISGADSEASKEAEPCSENFWPSFIDLQALETAPVECRFFRQIKGNFPKRLRCIRTH